MLHLPKDVKSFMQRNLGLVTRAHLLDGLGISKHTVDNWVKAELLDVLYRAIYRHHDAFVPRFQEHLAAVWDVGGRACMDWEPSLGMRGLPGFDRDLVAVACPRRVRRRPFQVSKVPLHRHPQRVLSSIAGTYQRRLKEVALLLASGALSSRLTRLIAEATLAEVA